MYKQFDKVESLVETTDGRGHVEVTKGEHGVVTDKVTVQVVEVSFSKVRKNMDVSWIRKIK